MNKVLHFSVLIFGLLPLSAQAMVGKNDAEQYKALMNLKSTGGWAPLHTAAYSGNADAVKELLAFEAEVDVKESFGRTPLMFSCIYNKVEIARLFLEKGASLRQADKDGLTPLHHGCKFGHAPIIEELVAKGASVDVLDNAQKSPLHHALSCSNSSAVEAVWKALKKKADAEKQTPSLPLHVACQNCCPEKIEELILGGARVDELDKEGNSPLHYAASNTNPAIMKTLLAALKKKSGGQAALAQAVAQEIKPATATTGLASDSLPLQQS